jgi:hypothetical protein
LAVEPRARLAHDFGDVSQIGIGAALAGALLGLREQERERLVQELDGLEERVREALLEGLLRVQHPVLTERVLDDERHRALGPHELRDQLRAAPAGDESQQHLGAGEMADVRRDRAVVAVQRDLDAAAHGGPVDRGERDERKIAQAAEELVSRLAALAGTLGRDLAELADVRSDREDERLPGEHEPAPVARLQLPEQLLERAQSVLAERVRLLPVLTVVHGHERDRADARSDLLELEPRRGASHRSGRPSPLRRRRSRHLRSRAAPSSLRR